MGAVGLIGCRLDMGRLHMQGPKQQISFDPSEPHLDMLM